MRTQQAVYVIVGIALLLLVAMFFVVALGPRNAGGGSYESELVPVAPVNAPTSSAPRDGFSESSGMPEDVPPESTLSHRRESLGSTGELLSVWEHGGLFSEEVSPSQPKNRSDGELPLSDGGLLTVPQGAVLEFDYGGEASGVRTFDALAFGLQRGELWREERSGQLFAQDRPARAITLPFQNSDGFGFEQPRMRANLPPGVYVVSVSVSAEQGDARYNFRVQVTDEEETEG